MGSFIYQNIGIYRSVMQLLYKGSYYRRFDPVKKIIKENNISSVNELCFGDTAIARFCRENNISWLGSDRNKNFVDRAKKLGFKAELKLLKANSRIQEADLILMMGSLYHFGNDSKLLLQNMMDAAKIVVISEPVRNWVQKKSIGKWAARFSDSGSGDENFRFTQKSLLKLADEVCIDSLYSYNIYQENEKDLILVFERK